MRLVFFSVAALPSTDYNFTGWDKATSHYNQDGFENSRERMPFNWPSLCGLGVLIQILCSYVTLPLYALVTQIGSTMKPTIFDERVANALRKWHHKAKKNIKQNQHSTSTPETPMHSMSPVHLLHHYQGEIDSIHKTQRMSNFNNEGRDMKGPPFILSPP